MVEHLTVYPSRTCEELNVYAPTWYRENVEVKKLLNDLRELDIEVAVRHCESFHLDFWLCSIVEDADEDVKIGQVISDLLLVYKWGAGEERR